MAPVAPPLIAVINSSIGIARVLQRACEFAGYRTIIGLLPQFPRGAVDGCTFLVAHQPRAVIFDVSPPYASGWRLLTEVRRSLGQSAPAFLVTSTNPQAVSELAGSNLDIELV